MATTLVIKQGYFSANKLTTVALDTQVPCAGIALNNSTLNVEYGATGSLTATILPADCTDPIVWTSSDSTVATVANGTITPVGVGSATITATCGSYSATCAVTVKAFLDNDYALKFVKYYCNGNGVVSSGNGLPTFNSTSEYRGGFAASSGTLRFYKPVDAHPYVFPPNTKRIKISKNSADITRPTNLLWLNSQTAAGSSFSEVALMLDKTDSFDASLSEWTIEVPTYTGYAAVDSFAVSFISDSVFTEAILNAITIEFLPAAAS